MTKAPHISSMSDWKDAALLLVGHGSSKTPNARQAASRLAERLRALNLFAEVRACFWKEEPFVSLDLVRSRIVHVVPYFSGAGVFTKKLIPERLGLTGRVSEIAGRTVYYSEPVGTHPEIPCLLCRRAHELCRVNGIKATDATLLMIAHGSSKPGGSSGTPEAVAERLRRDAGFAEVAIAYIEQEPFVCDWPKLVSTRHVIGAPLLVSEGMHASQDLPPLFGLTAPEGGPSEIGRHLVWLMGGIGRDPEVAQIILDLITATQYGESPALPCHHGSLEGRIAP
ncbi:MAG TPA: CbiX/SirB N-terminal domain-containing protein [Candidatus Sulfotelmatobacter sp.]|jgi:sirohydrochlorin cobaltochelatase|nr:CbiX/SirB N-terminal domain-containing protein [Candidatus Sulfotelmatobacter sp.]